MSVVTEHLEQRGSVFEVIPHRQAYTSVDEARALGIEVGEVLKTLAVRTGSGYALMVIPASHRLDLHLVRQALGDNRLVWPARRSLVVTSPTTSWVPYHRSGRCRTRRSMSIRRCWATIP